MVATINRPPLYLFSNEHMPLVSKMAYQQKWYGTDSEERYKNNPHSFLGPEDVVYRFNSLGYRCPEFNADRFEKKLTVVSIGASEVFGIGLPEDKVFAQVFADLLAEQFECNVVNWNLGLGGSCADYMSRVIVSALPVLKPDIVLLVFPFYGRREHIDDNGRIFYFNHRNAEYNKNRLKNSLIDPLDATITQAQMALSSDHGDQINLYKNYQVCASLCEKYKVMWLFSAFHIAFFSQLQHLIATPHLVGPGLEDLKCNYQVDPGLRLARDMQHPGIGPHKEMAENLFERLKSLYFDRLVFG